MQPKIDFHNLWIATPKPGTALPRPRADGLGVEISLSGTAKQSGTVLAVDEKMPTLEGDPYPLEYKAYGLLGQGRVEIAGFATLAGSFGFLEVQTTNGDFKKSFFLVLEQGQVAYEIPTIRSLSRHRDNLIELATLFTLARHRLPGNRLLGKVRSLLAVIRFDR